MKTEELNCDICPNGAPAVILPYEADKEYTVEDLGEVKKKPMYCFWKRIFDIVISAIALIVMALPMLIIAIVVRCTSKGPALYCQDRLGLNGKKICVPKFRTMILDAEKDGAQWSSGKDDARITTFGHFLRNTRLDELPQFWSILIGDMSLVGPRPEREVFYEKFEQYIHGFSQRLKVKPGLSGLAQVNGGYYLRPEEKIVYDVEYIKKRSLWLDMKIILMTVKVIIARVGAK